MDLKQELRDGGLAVLLVVYFALAFVFVPQWIIVELPLFSRPLRVWLAVLWVALALGAAGYAAIRVTTPKSTGEPQP